jgi:hypothetical protein
MLRGNIMGLSAAYKYSSFNGTAGTDFTEVVFKFASRWIDIFVYNNSITFQLQHADGIYGDEIIADPTTTAFPVPIFFQTKGIMIKNTDPALVASYQIVAYQ